MKQERETGTVGNRARVVVTTPTFLPIVGGAEVGIHEICARLSGEFDVTVITLLPRRRNLDQYAADDYSERPYQVRYALERTAVRSPEPLLRLLNRSSVPLLLEVWRQHRKNRVDLLNLHFIKQQAGVALLGRLSRIPVVTSLVGRSDVVRLLPRRKRLYTKLVAKLTTVTVPNSTFYLRQQSFGGPTKIIPYGVNTTLFHPDKRDAKLRQRIGVDDHTLVLLTVQRLAPVKAVDVLVRVVKDLVERGVDVVLVIAGKGEQEAALRKYVEQLKLEKHVCFLGYVPSQDMPALFASADVYVSHSMFETFGIVFAQAMAAGIPVIAADSSSIPDVLRPENGAIIPAGDVARFADEVETLARDPTRRAGIGRANRARAVGEMDWDTIAGEYRELFRTLLS